MLHTPMRNPTPVTAYSKAYRIRGEQQKCKILLLTNIKLQQHKNFLQEISHLNPTKLIIHNPFELAEPEDLKSLCNSIIKMRKLSALDISSGGNSEILSLFIGIIRKIRRIRSIRFDFSKTSLSKENLVVLLRSLSRKKHLSELRANFDASKCNQVCLLGELNDALLHLKQLRSLKIFLKSLDKDHVEQINPVLTSMQKLNRLQDLDLNLDKCTLDNFSLKILMRTLENLNKIKNLKMKLILDDESFKESIDDPHIFYRFNYLQKMDLSLRCEENSFDLMKFIKPLDMITHLTLDYKGTQFKDKELEILTSMLTKFQKLEKLDIDLSSCYLISPDGINGLFTSLGNLINLHDLTLVLNKFYNGEIFGEKNMLSLKSSLLNLPNLQGLSLHCGRTSVRDCTYSIIGEGLSSFKNLRRLELAFENSLNCSESRFIAILKGILNHYLLEELKLTLQCCEFKDEVLYSLAESVCLLKYLTIFESRFPFHGNFTPFGIARFRQRLQKNKQLKRLVIIESPRAPVKAHQNQDLVMIILINFIVFFFLYHAFL